MTEWLFAFIPVLAAGSGAAYIALRAPGDETVGVIQHFSAGVILYAAAGEFLPDATRYGRIGPVIAGGAVAIAALLILRRFTKQAPGPARLVGAAALDGLVDGFVLGLGFSAGARQGMLIGIALAIEYLFLGLSVSAAFGRQSSRWRTIGATLGISLLLPIGTLAAIPIHGLPARYQTAAFAFGLIAMLYLVTEELLVEAHEKPETPWGTQERRPNPRRRFVG